MVVDEECDVGDIDYLFHKTCFLFNLTFLAPMDDMCVSPMDDGGFICMELCLCGLLCVYY